MNRPRGSPLAFHGRHVDPVDSSTDALDDVVGAITGNGGHEPADEELRELGVDPETARTQGDLPDVLQE